MPDGRANTLVINTPEGISFSLVLAGPLTRFFAWSIDLACIFVASFIISSLSVVLGVISLDLANAVGVLMYFAISIGYGIALEWLWRGQTIGKRLMRLRVMDVQGLRLQFSQIVIRNLLRFVDSLPGLYLVGGLACLLSRSCQRLGDYAANTIVIRTSSGAGYDPRKIASDKYNSFRDYPHLEARLRQRASQGEAALALEALIRRDSFDPVSRVELFRDIAYHFQSLVAFPEDATLGLTDEQYVRNVVDSLFRTRGKQGSNRR
jgi:uncharacterized RDD family membrane protein YckC